MEPKFNIDAERLAYWYLRLNGCLTIQNFVVHPDKGREQKTDVDILAVRFPHRAELLHNSMKDDELVFNDERLVVIYLAEVKLPTCKFNGPWRDPKRKNMERVIRAVGAFPTTDTDTIARNIYTRGYHEDDRYRMSLLAIGRNRNTELAREYPRVPQVMWSHILIWIHKRFADYREVKMSHPQWDTAGRNLFAFSAKFPQAEDFASHVEITSG